MRSIYPFTLTLLSSTTSAQTGAGFPVDAVDTLEVVFGNMVVNPTGELIPRALTANPPTIYTPTFPTNGTGVILMVDQDVPLNQTYPLNSVRVSLVHWLAPGVTCPNINNSLQITNPSPDNPQSGVTYLQPTPPPGDIPHRYNILLFAQPAGFTLPPPYNNITTDEQRHYFNITDFIAATGLTLPLAADYFEVQQYLNGTNTTSTSTKSSSSGATGSSTASSAPAQATTSTAIARFYVNLAETALAIVATMLFTILA